MVGFSTALSIKQLHPEASVAVLERGILPSGASTRNAGFACFGSLTELMSDIDSMGEDQVRQLVEDRWTGLKLLRERIGDSKLQFRNHGGYELLFDKDLHYLDKLERANTLLMPVFRQEVFAVNNELIEKFGFNKSRVAAVISNPLEGQLHAGAMMKSIIQLAKSQDIDYLTGTTVKKLEKDLDTYTVACEANPYNFRFQCKRVAVCTNAFTQSLLPDLPIKVGRGTILVTKSLAHLKFQGVFHYHQGFYYFRNIGSRVLFGGGRNLDLSAEETVDLGFNQRIVDHLRYELSDLILPNQEFEIQQQWSGIMAFGNNKRPLVGLHSPGIGYAVRLGGMGVALGSLVGHRLAKLICFAENA